MGGSRWPGAWPAGPDVAALTRAGRCPIRGSCAAVCLIITVLRLPPRAAVGKRLPALPAVGLGCEVPADWDLGPDGLRLRSRICDAVISLLRRRQDRSLCPTGRTQRPHGLERIHSMETDPSGRWRPRKEDVPARSPGAWGQGDVGLRRAKGLCSPQRPKPTGTARGHSENSWKRRRSHPLPGTLSAFVQKWSPDLA